MIEHDELTEEVIGCAIEVHKELGPGLLESAYRKCLMRELELNNLAVAEEVPLSLHYKGVEIDQGYRIDLLVEDELVLELKTVENIESKHKAQLLTYLRIGEFKKGLLINFSEKLLKSGIRRLSL